MDSKRLISVLALAGAAAVSNASCTARAGVVGSARTGPPVHYYHYEPATLVYVDSRVWVVRDSSYPVYFCDGYYWAYYDYGWYRSHTYDGSWVRVDVYLVPQRIARRDHRVYVHYQGTGVERRRAAPRGPRMRPASLDRPAPRAEPPTPIRIEPNRAPRRDIQQPSPRRRPRLEQAPPTSPRPLQRPAPRSPPRREPAPDLPKRPWVEARGS